MTGCLMGTKQRCALVAARPAGCRVLQQMLRDAVEVMPVHTMEDAFELLACGLRRIDLIVATFTFDESQMFEFLQAVKRDRDLREIPFYCVRVRPGVLEDE